MTMTFVLALLAFLSFAPSVHVRSGSDRGDGGSVDRFLVTILASRTSAAETQPQHGAVGSVETLALDAPSPGSVTILVDHGLVTIRASRVSAAEILKQYGAVGRVEILNLDVLPSNDMTITLENVPETMALDILTRQCGGYLATRRNPDDLNRSGFNRIVLFRESASPSAGRAPSVPLPPPPVEWIEPAPGEVRPRLGPDGKPMEDDQQRAPHPTVER